MSALLVMKFGGTSVGSAACITRAVAQVASQRDHLPFVVVSALSGVTDLLVALNTQVAARNAEEVDLILEQIIQRHIGLAQEILRGERLFEFYENFYADFGLLERLTHRLIGEGGFSAREQDHILSFGERFSSRLFVLKLRDYSSRAHWCDAQSFVITEGTHGNARPDQQRTAARIQHKIKPLLDHGRIIVTQGFVGATPHGAPTTLGRGGSDYTATFLGSLLAAQGIEIWTDVDGVYTADPKKNANAIQLPVLSLDTAYQMASDGAKVIYPPCLLPLYGTDIPLRILSTFEPEKPGTYIYENLALPQNPKFDLAINA